MNMHSDLYLHFAAICVSYFLKVTAGYFTCLAVSRFLGTPRARFVLWMAFLIVSSSYWVYLGINLFESLPNRPLVSGTADGNFLLPAHRFFVPLAWKQAANGVGMILTMAYLAGVLLLGLRALWKHAKLHHALK